MMRMPFSFFLLPAVLIAGCGAGQTGAKESADQPTASSSKPGDDANRASNAEPASPAVSKAVILRSDMDKVISAGPAALLAEVLTEPVRKDGRFIGFKIAKFNRGEPESIDLKTGDVILLVNGRKIERPENYFEVFEELKTAAELRFKVMRDGEEMDLVYPIVD